MALPGSEPEFDALIGRLRAGDEAAAALIFHRFAHRLIALARSRLANSVRPKMDPEDVLQSAYRSFFRRQAQGLFDVRDWDSLWALLATITLRKCGHRIEHFHAARRDVRREVVTRSRPDDSGASWEAIAREPRPEEAMALAETLEQVMTGFDDRQRKVLQLSMDGYSPADIGSTVGCTERTVHRVLERVRRRLERMRQKGLESFSDRHPPN